jgi:NitT/TauT family transport system substrate-binding protein
MTARPRPATATVVAGLVALALAGCTSSSSVDPGDPDAEAAEAGGSADPVTITVGTLKGQPHLYHPFFYADHLPEGYEVEVITFDTSPDIKNAVASGSIDFGVTGIPAALSGIVSGEDVVVVASAADGGTGIVGKPEIAGVEDLVGRTVGFPQGASQEILLRLTLEAHGVDIDDLELVNLPFSDMANAYASGQIDAFSSAELGPSIAKLAGAVEIADPYETPVGKVNIGLVTTRALIDRAPELVQTLVDAHVAATEAMVADPEAWAAGVVATFGLDPEVVEVAIGNIWPRWTLEDTYLEQVIALATEMNALGYLDGVPTVEDVFDTSFVASDS